MCSGPRSLVPYGLVCGIARDPDTRVVCDPNRWQTPAEPSGPAIDDNHNFGNALRPRKNSEFSFGFQKLNRVFKKPVPDFQNLIRNRKTESGFQKLDPVFENLIRFLKT